MGRRRRSRPKNPRRGPGHNEANRQTRESRQRTKMLNHAQETRFRYYMEEILIEQHLMEPETARPLIQGLWTQGFRNSIEECKDWLHEKVDEGDIPAEAKKSIMSLIDKYSKYR